MVRAIRPLSRVVTPNFAPPWVPLAVGAKITMPPWEPTSGGSTRVATCNTEAWQKHQQSGESLKHLATQASLDACTSIYKRCNTHCGCTQQARGKADTTWLQPCARFHTMSLHRADLLQLADCKVVSAAIAIAID